MRRGGWESSRRARSSGEHESDQHERADRVGREPREQRQVLFRLTVRPRVLIYRVVVDERRRMLRCLELEDVCDDVEACAFITAVNYTGSKALL